MQPLLSRFSVAVLSSSLGRFRSAIRVGTSVGAVAKLRQHRAVVQCQTHPMGLGVICWDSSFGLRPLTFHRTNQHCGRNWQLADAPSVQHYSHQSQVYSHRRPGSLLQAALVLCVYFKCDAGSPRRLQGCLQDQHGTALVDTPGICDAAATSK